jgi:hypothetical protein
MGSFQSLNPTTLGKFLLSFMKDNTVFYGKAKIIAPFDNLK